MKTYDKIAARINSAESIDELDEIIETAAECINDNGEYISLYEMAMTRARAWAF